jgi:hypothetical protein
MTLFGLSTLGLVHTALSLGALVSGLVVVAGLITGRRLDRWTAFYVATAAATIATGFAFRTDFGIPQYLGLFGGAALVVAIVARYDRGMAGLWRPIYAAAAVVSVHTLVFFTIGEAFLRIPALHELAPTLTERPFALTQLVGIALFIGLAIVAVRRVNMIT